MLKRYFGYGYLYKEPFTAKSYWSIMIGLILLGVFGTWLIKNL